MTKPKRREETRPNRNPPGGLVPLRDERGSHVHCRECQRPLYVPPDSGMQPIHDPDDNPHRNRPVVEAHPKRSQLRELKSEEQEGEQEGEQTPEANGHDQRKEESGLKEDPRDA